MNKVKNKLILDNIKLYFEKKITKFGNSAKIDCPKKFIGKKAIVIIENDKS
ncbi:DUF2080 family transposase-associated protein [Patescibacteria group bacterium]|nr:DUF2080 family transposase-associated protein [Patescibacteria group bacterium]MBU4069751.1 DUF2080 family transposase-associated protein [Nanoarchaeota archaeon]